MKNAELEAIRALADFAVGVALHGNSESRTEEMRALAASLVSIRAEIAQRDGRPQTAHWLESISAKLKEVQQ